MELSYQLIFRYVILSEGSNVFDLTKSFFREQLFKGLKQNILKNNTWGSYNVLPCVDYFVSTKSNDIKFKKYFDNERFVLLYNINVLWSWVQITG